MREQEELLAALAKKNAEENKRKHRIRVPKSSKPIQNELINGKYILVSGSFATSSGARRRLSELKKKGIKAYLYYNSENGRNYAYIRAFNSREDAQKYSKSQVIESWIYSLPKNAQGKPEEVKKENSVVILQPIKNNKPKLSLPSDLPFLIVSGSFKEKRNAETRVKQLKSINKLAFVYFNSKNGNYYACLGSFNSIENANSYLKKSTEEGWVFKR